VWDLGLTGSGGMIGHEDARRTEALQERESRAHGRRTAAHDRDMGGAGGTHGSSGALEFAIIATLQPGLARINRTGRLE
jgi:hypothetical protein